MEIAIEYLRSRQKICIIISLGSRVNTARKRNAPVQDNEKKKRNAEMLVWKNLPEKSFYKYILTNSADRGGINMPTL